MARDFPPEEQFACAACGVDYARETAPSTNAGCATGPIVMSASTSTEFVSPAGKNRGNAAFVLKGALFGIAINRCLRVDTV